MDKKKVQIIIGSTRPGRIGEQIAQWIKSQFNLQDEIEAEIIDLEKINLPFLDEPNHPSMSQYTKDHTKKWSEKIKQGSGYIWLTPEYNSGYSAALKNAVDYLYHEWANKPILIASYGVNGGPTANKNLLDVVNRLKAKAVEPRIEITIKPEMRGEDGLLKNPSKDLAIYKDAVSKSLKELVKEVNDLVLV